MTNTEYLIVGAGPAGLQLGHHLQQAGRDYAILEAGSAPGGFFRTFPRHRRLISINKPHTGWDDPELNLRMDWNSLLSDDPRLLFTRYTERYFPDADDLVRYLADYAATLRLRIVYGTRVRSVARADGGFVVARRARRHPPGAARDRGQRRHPAPHPPIPGIETAERYGEVSVDPRDFLDQRVLVIGKGNSGVRDRRQPDRDGGRHPRRGPGVAADGVAIALRRAPAGGQQQPARHLPAQVPERAARRDRPADRAPRRRLPGHRQLRARRRGHAGPALRPRDRVHRVPVRPLDLRRRLPPGARDRRPVPGPDARVGVDQRARAVLRRHA